MSTLLGSGVGILPSLESLAEQPNEHFRAVVEELHKLIASGVYLSHAMSRFPRVFSKVYTSMIRVGESSGSLVATLDRLSGWLDEEDALMRRVTSALTYPAIVLLSSMAMTLILFYFVMPGFVEIFRELGTELPLVTKVLILITETLTSPIACSLGIVVFGLAAYRISQILETERGQYAAYSVLVQFPLLGETIQLLGVARFCSSLSTMIGAGVSLPLTLRLSCLASGSPIYWAEAENLIGAVSEGETIASYMRSHPQFYPSTLVQMVDVAEESSRLEPLLRQASGFYSDEVRRRLDSLASALEPIMLLVASVGVGVVLLGVFLPLYGFLNEIGA
jgi:type IV pilus assembly protein PilC